MNRAGAPQAHPVLPARHGPPGATQPLVWPGEGACACTCGPALRHVNVITGPYALLAADLELSAGF